MALLASARCASRRGCRLGTAALALVLLLGGVCHAQVDEHALKAAFVYNIVAFAQWRDAPTGTLTICVQADAGLESAIAAMAGRPVAGRRVKVARSLPDVGCDVRVHGAQVPMVAAADTLIICDACHLPNGASAIALVREGNKIRFDVDATRARADGIVLSSQLLRLARRVL